MRLMYLFRVFGVIVILSTMMVACKSTKSTMLMSSEFPLTVVGDDGVELTMSRPPQSIIAFDGSAVEIIFAIGEGDRVVGAHSFANYPDAAAEIVKVGDAFQINFEKVVELKPDLFFVFFESFVEDIRGLGINVLYLEPPKKVDDIIERITLWGAITDSQERANDLAKITRSRLDDVEHNILKRSSNPSVLHDAGDLWTMGDNTFIGDVYNFLKTENIARDVDGWHQLSAEVIIERDPDVIVTTDVGGVDFFRTHSAFKELSAVKNNRIYFVGGDILSNPGPRIVEAVRELEGLLYRD